jgi:hypothetical protein
MLKLISEPEMYEPGQDRRVLGTGENAERWA